MRRLQAVFISCGASLLLAWTGWLLFGGIGFSPKSVMDMNWLASLFTQNLVVTIASLVLIGLSMGAAIYAARRLEKYQAVPLGFVLAAVGGLPLALSMDLFEFIMLGACYLLGAAAVSFLVAGKRGKGLTKNIGKGMGHAKKAFYTFAIASFVVVFLLASVQHDAYEETFRNNIKDLVAQSSGTMMSKSQIRALVEAQLGPSGDTQAQALMASANMTYTKAVFAQQIEAIYSQLNTDLTNAGQSPLDVNKATEAAYSDYYTKAMSPEGQAEQQAMMAGMFLSQGNGASGEQIDALVDRMYEQFNDPDKAAALAETSTQMLENMPMFQMVLEWLGIVYAFAFVSLVLVAESIMIGPAAGLGYGAMCWLMPEDREEEELRNQKPADDKNVKELVGSSGFSRERSV